MQLVAPPALTGHLGFCFGRRVPRTASRDEAQDWAQISPKSSQNSPNHVKSSKPNMLKFGNVSFDFGFER